MSDLDENVKVYESIRDVLQYLENMNFKSCTRTAISYTEGSKLVNEQTTCSYSEYEDVMVSLKKGILEPIPTLNKNATIINNNDLFLVCSPEIDNMVKIESTNNDSESKISLKYASVGKNGLGGTYRSHEFLNLIKRTKY